MKALPLGFLILAVAGVALAQTPAKLQVGDVAPGFTLPYATRDSIPGDSLRLASLVGKRNVVLAFYPADWSGGCTREVCMLRDNFSALGELNAEVVGISGDYVASHFAWAKEHKLPFALASDHSHATAKAYGSYNEANGYDRRTMFVIDKAGKIAYTDMAYSSRDTTSFVKLKTALAGLR